MKRVFGQVGRLKPEMAEQYASLHLNPWPELLAVLKRYGFENYSIFRQGEWVFSYFEYSGQSYKEDMALLEEEPVMHRWWAQTKPCFERYAMDETAEFYKDMQQVFYLP